MSSVDEHDRLRGSIEVKFFFIDFSIEIAFKIIFDISGFKDCSCTKIDESESTGIDHFIHGGAVISHHGRTFLLIFNSL